MFLILLYYGRCLSYIFQGFFILGRKPRCHISKQVYIQLIFCYFTNNNNIVSGVWFRLYQPSLGGRNHPLLPENRYFSATEQQPLDHRQVCKLEAARCTLIEKENRALFLFWVCCVAHKKLQNTFIQIKKLRFLTIFNKIANFFKNLFWILVIYVIILTPVKKNLQNI